MKRMLRISLLLVLSTALITSCKKGAPKQTKHISKSASFVATINTKSIKGKLAKNQASIENIIRSLSGSDTAVNNGRQEWEELQSAGIDLDDNLYVAVSQTGGDQASSLLTGLAGLTDASKLEAYIKKKQPKAEVRKEKDYSYITTGGSNMLAWGRDMIVAMSYQQSTAGLQMEIDTATGQFSFKQPVNAEANLKTEMDNCFNMKEEASVASIPEFRDLLADKSDAGFWVNSEATMQNIPFPLPRLKALLSNNYTAATLNFEDGKISMDSKSYYSKDLAKLLKENMNGSADMALIENYPSANINGFGVMSFNPRLILQLVNYLEVGGIVDSYLTKNFGNDYGLEQLLKAIKGDVAFVVSDLAVNQAGSPTIGRTFSMPSYNALLNLPVNDRSQMNKLLDALVRMQMLDKVGGSYQLKAPLQQMGWQFSIDDKNLVIASGVGVLNDYKSKTKKANLSKDVTEGFNGKPAVFYVNIESILNAFPAGGSSTPGAVLTKAKETFKDIKGYSGSFNGDYMKGHGELRFKNEKENSLTSLLSFVEFASKNVGKMPRRYFDPGLTDSVAAPLPPM